jgi:hypothetical protein
MAALTAAVRRVVAERLAEGESQKRRVTTPKYDQTVA